MNIRAAKKASGDLLKDCLMKLPQIILCLAAIVAAKTAMAQSNTNFTVTSPGFFFNVNGFGTTQNPTLNLRAGNTYIFHMSTTTGSHPVDIVTNLGTPHSSFYYSGASAQVSSSVSPPVTLTIPSSNFPSTLFYVCDIHGFSGQINVAAPLAPPAPPQNIIISIVVSPTNVTIKSSGTNTTYTLVPEFRSNFLSGSWLSVPSFSNSFTNGTNTTTFGRLDAICGSNVFLRISQRPPQ